MKTHSPKYAQALSNIPPTGSGCHSSILSVANIGILTGHTPEQVFDDIRRAIPTSGNRQVPDREIWDAVNKSARECNPGQPTAQRRPDSHQRPAFDGSALRQQLIRRGSGAHPNDLSQLSTIPIAPDPRDHANNLLATLYKPQDLLFVGDTYGREVYSVKQILERFLASEEVPPHVIPNPMTGTQALTKLGDLSYRCDNTVSQHRFAVVEFDDMPQTDQIAFWHTVITQHLLPVAVLIDSGGKSIHAWLELNLPNAEAWQSVVRHGLYHPTAGRMTLLGADRACQNPSRLSRMPGHWRDTGKWQRLLYLASPQREC